MATGPVTELSEPADDPALLEQRIAALLRQMTLEEKIGQLALVPGAGGQAPDQLHQALREGRVGSILNEVQVDTVNELQRIAVEESRLGIPLLIGRDVIHGFTTVFPIPLGQAAPGIPISSSAEHGSPRSRPPPRG